MTVSAPTTVEATGMVALEQLDPNHWPNPRGDVDTASPAFLELSASIASQGMLEPIVIGPALDELDGRHPIIAGWRRYTAALVAGMPAVPVHHRPDIADEASALRAALAENLAREDMTPLAEASAIARLVELGDTQVAAAAAVGVSERTARERLRLLTLPPAVQTAIAGGKVPSTAGRRLQQIAEASPAAAVWIAEGIEGAHIRVADLFDDVMTGEVLAEAAHAPGVTLAYIGGGVSPRDIADKDLAKRVKTAVGSEYGALGLRAPDSLLDAARATGALLELGDDQYLTDPDLEREAIEYSIELAAKAKRDRDAEQKRLRAKHAKSDEQDPAARARAEHQALVDAVNERARPNAEAMNLEIGRRLRGMSACTIEGPVAQLVLHLADSYGRPIKEYATYGYKRVDPGRKLADDWAKAKDPHQAAAELVRACVAALFCDPRGIGDAVELPYQFRDDARNSVVHAAALKLKLLPDRAIAFAAARERLAKEREYHGDQGARRRILLELDTEDSLELDDLRARTKDFRGSFEQPEIAHQIYSTQDFTDALDQLIAAELVSATDVEGAPRLCATAAGLAVLLAAPAPPPIIEDIDGVGVELQLVDEPDADADELRIVLEQPERSVPAKQRRGRALELITAHPGITIPELAHGMALKQNYLYRILPTLLDEGLVRKDGRGWHPVAAADGGAGVAIVHVTPTGGGEPVEAELQPDAPKGKSNSRKVIYTASRTAAWVAESRITDLPVEAAAA